VKEKIRLTPKMKCHEDERFWWLLLNYEGEYYQKTNHHQKTNLMLCPFSVPPQPVFPHPLTDDAIHEKGWQDITKIPGFSNWEFW
jgi:hypothetical protein